MLYRFYQLENGIKRYLRDDCESYTRDVGLAGTFSQAAWDEWGYDGFELEEIGEDEKMRLAGAPQLPGMGEVTMTPAEKCPCPSCTWRGAVWLDDQRHCVYCDEVWTQSDAEIWAIVPWRWWLEEGMISEGQIPQAARVTA